VSGALRFHVLPPARVAREGEIAVAGEVPQCTAGKTRIRESSNDSQRVTGWID
jgi:hypothetical protein